MSTGIFKDWWYHYEECTERELVGIYRRMKRRQTDHVTDEPILNPPLRAASVGQTILHDRTCSHCGRKYTPRTQSQRFCAKTCTKAAQNARQRGMAQREAS
jgi:hypothetical protein